MLLSCGMAGMFVGKHLSAELVDGLLHLLGC